MDDPAELVRIYAFAAGKAMSTRAIITNLEQTAISKKPLLIRNNAVSYTHLRAHET